MDVFNQARKKAIQETKQIVENISKSKYGIEQQGDVH